MDWITEPFATSFMQRALLAGVLVSVICGVVGTFVVLRGLAFIGDALAHGVLPGIAAAALLQIPGVLGAAAGAAVMIGGIGLVTRRSRLSSDTAIGLLFVGTLALGVVIVSASTSFRGDLMNILFGNILGVSRGDLLLLAATALAVSLVVWVFHRPLLMLSFDPAQAQASGYSERRYSSLLLFLIAAAVVVSFQAVGTLLVFAMLLAPASVGALVGHRLPTMMAAAIGAGALSVLVGLLVSFHWDLAASASIALTAVVLFFVTLAVANLRSAGHGT